MPRADITEEAIEVDLVKEAVSSVVHAVLLEWFIVEADSTAEDMREDLVDPAAPLEALKVMEIGGRLA